MQSPVLANSASYMRSTRGRRRFDNLGGGSWMAWANDTAAHYATIQLWEQLKTWFAAIRHTTPMSHTRPSPRSP